MTILNILNVLEALETGLMNVYKWFSEQFKEKDEELSRFFLKMSHEESSHKNLVNYQKNLVRKNPKMFENVEVNLNEIEMMIRLTDNILIEKPIITKKSALDFALNMESYAAEGLYKKVIIESCPTLKDLMENLTKEDEAHVERLQKFYKKSMIEE